MNEKNVEFIEIDESDVEFWESQCKKNNYLSGKELLNLNDKEIGYQNVCEKFRNLFYLLYYKFYSVFV